MLGEQLKTIFPYLTDQDLVIFDSESVVVEYKNKEAIIDPSKSEQYLYIILEGMSRGYFIDASGSERTVFIRPTLSFFTSPEYLNQSDTKKYYFEAIQTTRVLKFSYERFVSLATTSLSFSRLYADALKENTLKLIYRIELLATQSNEERYESLMLRHPEFFRSAQHQHIANYLGMTATSLSRIIKRKKG